MPSMQGQLSPAQDPSSCMYTHAANQNLIGKGNIHVLARAYEYA